MSCSGLKRCQLGKIPLAKSKSKVRIMESSKFSKKKKKGTNVCRYNTVLNENIKVAVMPKFPVLSSATWTVLIQSVHCSEMI